VPLLGALSADAFGQAATVKASSHPLREIVVSYADATNILESLFPTKKMQLFRINDDGSARRRISNCAQDCSMPAWSPDGKKIVYLQQTAQGNSIWLSDPDGGNSRMLLESGINMEPSWLPDSKNIVWFALKQGRSNDPGSKLYIMDIETLQSRPLFSDPEQIKYANLMPAVSPDGKRVAFVSNRSGHFRIWLSNLDGSHAKPISPVEAEQDETLHLPIEQKVPSWSPDGQWIAHWEGLEMDHLSGKTGRSDPQRDALIEGSWNVWVVDSEGKRKRKAGHGDDPTWSPDGLLTRSFPDQAKGGANVMIQTIEGWKELPILPANTARYGRFTWKPASAR
jgi:TolB protein